MNAITRITVLFVIFAFAKAYQANAQQNFTGIATYQSKMTIERSTDSTALAKHAKRDPKVQAAIEAAIKNAGQATFTLQFNKDESIYEKMKELAKPKPKSGFSMTISGGGDTYGKTYKDLKEQTFIREDNIMGKEFLVTDELPKYEWKISSETKMIGQYQAIKATYTQKPEESDDESEGTSLLDMIPDEEEVVTAWFTPQIPISNGPGAYQGLPGLILELNTGEVTILCTQIELNPEMIQIKKPKKGKKMKLEAFNKLQKQKQDEMMERFKNKRGGDSGVQIIGGF